jgi:hypothetical protein
MKKKVTFQVDVEDLDTIEDLKKANPNFRELSIGALFRTAFNAFMKQNDYVLTSDLSNEELVALFDDPKRVPKWIRKNAYARPYHRVRWTWLKRYKREELIDALHAFTLSDIDTPMPTGFGEWEMLKVSADTLHAYLSDQRAVIFQTRGAPLTGKDEALQKAMFTLYGHDWAAPFFPTPR